jgi:DNA polymerase-3 subunit gamma/tau
MSSYKNHERRLPICHRIIQGNDRPIDRTIDLCYIAIAPMTYIPLHHKYRPQTFAQLVGQEAIATTLSSALTQNRIAPAYLFTGARGTGKTSSARIFAKSLNCIAGTSPTPTPCGVCEVCQEITKGNALDVIEIDAASNTGVDSIRELIERSQFAPVRCRYKVYIIDECHMLTSAAFNALLKTLEEPPDRVIFVLATTDPQRVLPTIISRCQRFDFRRIPLDSLVQHLVHIAKQENISIAPAALHLVGQISQGGLRDAESLLDQLSLSPDEVSVDKVWDLVGAVPERDLMALVQAIASDNAETMLDQTRKLMDRGREPMIVLQNLASFYRDLLIAKTAPTRNDLAAITPPTWAQMTTFANGAEIAWILQGQQHLRSAEVQIKHTTQPRLWLEITLMGLLPSALGSVVTPTNTDRVPTTARSQATAQPQAQPQVQPIAQPRAQQSTPQYQTQTQSELPPKITPIEISPETPPGQDLVILWQRILSNIEENSTRAVLSTNGYVAELNGDEIKIGILQKTSASLVKTRKDSLGNACAKTLKRGVKITFIITEGKGPKGKAHKVQPMLVEPTISTPSTPSQNIIPITTIPITRQAPPKPVTAPTIDHAPKAIEVGGVPSWEVDELTKATKSLAMAFDGKIVTLDDDVDVIEEPEASLPTIAQSSDALEDLEDEQDDDVEF